jgi:hypothetical protein
MTDPDPPDSGMASGSDAGGPGEHLGDGDLRPDEERLLAALERDADDPPEASDAEVRAAEDDAPLPDDGGAQDDGLEAGFSDPQPG